MYKPKHFFAAATFFCMLFFPALNAYTQEQAAENESNTQGTSEVKNYTGPVSPWIGLLFNLAPGFGAGSFIQGDSKNGILGFTTEICGAAIMAAGLSWRSSLEFDLASPSIAVSTSVTCAGFLLIAGSILFQLIAPFSFYEAQLKHVEIAHNKNNSGIDLVLSSVLFESAEIDGKPKTRIAYRFLLR